MSTSQQTNAIKLIHAKTKPKKVITPAMRKKMVAGIRKHHRQLRKERAIAEKSKPIMGKPIHTINFPPMKPSDNFKKSRKPSLQEVQKALRILERANLL